MKTETRQIEIRLADDPERMGPGKLEGVLMPYETRAADRPELFERGALHWPEDGVLLRAMHRRDSPIARFTPEASDSEVRVSIQLPDSIQGRSAAADVRAGVFRRAFGRISCRERNPPGWPASDPARSVGRGWFGGFRGPMPARRWKPGPRVRPGGACGCDTDRI